MYERIIFPQSSYKKMVEYNNMLLYCFFLIYMIQFQLGKL